MVGNTIYPCNLELLAWSENSLGWKNIGGQAPMAFDYGREYATTLLAFDPTNTIPSTTARDDCSGPYPPGAAVQSVAYVPGFRASTSDPLVVYRT
jgi:hypothetical protein